MVQARLNSERVPKKMLRDFAGTTLIDILMNKLQNSKCIPPQNIYCSLYEQELKDVVSKYNVNIFNRTKQSANSEGTVLSEIFDWHDKLPYKYVIAVSACNPLLKISTIDNFFETYLNSDKDGAFAVFEKKTYYWDKYGKAITDWKGSTTMNTKFVEPVYEAAHCLYGSKMDIIKDGFWIDTKSPPEPELFVMDELESFDIDHEWQFKLGEKLYEELK
jgi:CMP-N-acetylneuraminic acid synthetase